jgi:hypothetical protein
MSLFALHLRGYDKNNGKVGAMPPDTVVLGDLNVRGDGMSFIFEGANRFTSDDELCHMITGSPMQVVSTSRSDANTDIVSDHDWVMADVECDKMDTS